MCETLLRQREDQIREEYDKILAEKLSGKSPFPSLTYRFFQNNTKSSVATLKTSSGITSLRLRRATFPEARISFVFSLLTICAAIVSSSFQV